MRYFLKDDDEADTVLKNRTLTITVIGQGKMGLPISVVFLRAGYKVIGVDINKELVDRINEGKIQLAEEPGVEEGIKLGLKQEKYFATLNLEEAVKKADILIIIIPLILDEAKNPHLEPMLELFRNIGSVLERGQLVITETTLPINTTEGKFMPILEKESNLKAGVDFGLGFSPERTYSGQVIKDVENNYPKIIGGINEYTTKRMASFYETFVKQGTIQMSSATAAEAVKVFKGAYRDINIAIANELAKIAEILKLDFNEIRDAVNSEPSGNILKAGAGVGGHCIPVYPHFLINDAKEKGLDAKLIRSGREVNTSMPDHVISKVQDALIKLNKKIDDSKITILGLAYRGNVKEHRYSPSLDIINKLKQKGTKVVLNDPYYTIEEIKRIVDVEAEKNLEKAIIDSDCIILLTDHNEYKGLNLEFLDKLTQKPYVLMDTRNIIPEDKKNKENKRIHLKIGI